MQNSNAAPVFSVAGHPSSQGLVFGLGTPGIASNIEYNLYFRGLLADKPYTLEIKRRKAIRKQQMLAIWKCQVNPVPDQRNGSDRKPRLVIAESCWGTGEGRGRGLEGGVQFAGELP